MGNNAAIADGDSSSARLAAIGGCFYKNDFIYFTDRSSVRRLNLNTNRVSTLADGRNRAGTFSPKDGKGGSVIVSQPGAITGDEEGNLYFLDRVNLYNNDCSKRVGNYIRKISPPDKAISKLNIVSRGTSVQDVSVCYGQNNVAVFLNGVNIVQGTNVALNTISPNTFEIRNIGQYSISLQDKIFSHNQILFHNFSSISPTVLLPGNSAFLTVTSTNQPWWTTNVNITDYVNGYNVIWFGVKDQ